MDALKLIIKRQYFEEILNGVKVTETREVTPKNRGRYLDDDDEPRPFKQIIFYNGYRTDRKSLTVEITDAELHLLTDDAGNDIIYEYSGQEYHQAIVEYKLGKIISSTI